MFAADCLAPCLHGREAKQHAAAAATGHATRCTALGKVMRPREVHHVASASFVLLRHALDGRSFSQNHTGIVQHLVNQGKLEACEHQHGSSSIPLLLLDESVGRMASKNDDTSKIISSELVTPVLNWSVRDFLKF